MKKILFVCYILLMTGCSGESDILEPQEPQPKPVDDQLSLSSRDIESNYHSGREEFRVNTNLDWKAVSSAD